MSKELFSELHNYLNIDHRPRTITVPRKSLRKVLEFVRGRIMADDYEAKIINSSGKGFLKTGDSQWNFIGRRLIDVLGPDAKEVEVSGLRQEDIDLLAENILGKRGDFSDYEVIVRVAQMQIDGEKNLSDDIFPAIKDFLNVAFEAGFSDNGRYMDTLERLTALRRKGRDQRHD